jgi:hypothetical protein
MFRSQVSRLHRRSLSLAGAVILAAGLMTNIAAAAPADSATVPTGPKPPIITIGQSDFEVTNLGHEVLGNGSINYKFKIKNHGPDAARAKVHARVDYYLPPPSGDPYIVYDRTTPVLGNGAEIWMGFECPQPTQYVKCSDSYAEANVIAFDPNPNNNADYYFGPPH